MQSLRRRVAILLEAHEHPDWASRLTDYFLVILILGSVAAFVLETVPAVRQAYGPQLRSFEMFSVIVFTVEYLLRVWSCPDFEDRRFLHPVRGRLRWMTSPLGLIDLIAILPFYLALLLPIQGQALLILRAVRLFRIFKLTRYSPALRVMQQVLVKESSTLTVAAVLLLVILVFASYGIYILEREIQPEVFGTIPDAMWWAIVSLTTVGYGDVIPQTVGGKIFAGLISLIGIGMVALPAGILASGFSKALSHRTRTYQDALDEALADGVLSKTEVGALRALRSELGISDDEAEQYLRAAEARATDESPHCPHCGGRLSAAQASKPPAPET